MSKEITFYGADWCGDCRRSKRLLAELNVEYTLIDVEKDPSQIDTLVVWRCSKLDSKWQQDPAWRQSNRKFHGQGFQ